MIASQVDTDTYAAQNRTAGTPGLDHGGGGGAKT